MIEAWTAAGQGRTVEISEQAVLDAFDHVKLTDPRRARRERSSSTCSASGASTASAATASARTRASPCTTTRSCKTAAWLFGGLYIGVQLPLTARTQDVWDWTGSLRGAGAAGLVGRARGRRRALRRGQTHGRHVGPPEGVTWSFWDRYCDEAYCIISDDFLERGQAPNGFDLAALEADLALVTA